MKCEECGADQEEGSDTVVPAQVRAKIKSGEYAEDGERDDFLDHLELDGSEAAVADAVGGNLEAVLEEGDRPADDDDFPEGLALVFQMAIPGDGHEDVGTDEENDCPHLWGLMRRERLELLRASNELWKIR